MADQSKPDATGTVTISTEQFNSLVSKIDQLQSKVDDIPANEARLRAEETARLAEINSVFSVSGGSTLAAEFFTKHPAGTVEQAKAFAYDAILSKQGGQPGVPGGSNDGSKKDPDATFKAEYAADIEHFRKSGTTEADYVLSRRITENHQGRPLELVA